MDARTIIGVLGRNEYSITAYVDPMSRVLITGANGSIGTALYEKPHPKSWVFTDIDMDGEQFLDITDEYQVRQFMGKYKPEYVINLAGAKHAPEGEIDTFHTLEINTIGTQNLIKHKPKGCKIIQASTCKACNPETAYGATKLLAERIVLNDGGVVVRFYNVVETSGNVFELWDKQIKTDGRIKVVGECSRYFISLREAAGLSVYALNLKSGRYAINVEKPRTMLEIANEVHPFVQKTMIQPRRGDRLHEKLLGTSENKSDTYSDGAIVRINNYHDGI